MGIPKRTQNFRDRAKQETYDAQKEYEDSYKTKDDRGFVIGSVFDLDALKELGVEIWRPDVGEHVVDVIPFYAGRQHPAVKQGQRTYKVDFWAHQRIGALNEFFVCQSNTWKKPDPMCTFMSQNYIEDKNEYKKIKPSRRCGYLVWVHDNEEQEAKGIQVFEVAHFFFEKKVSEIAKKPRGGGFIDWTCYDKGKHVYWTIGVTGTYEDASGTKRDSIEYTAFQLIERDVPAIPDHILEQSFALDEAIKMFPTEEEMNLAFYGSAQTPSTPKTETSDRLKKKTPLERAKEKAAEKEAQDETPPEQDETPPEQDETPPEAPKETQRKLPLKKAKKEPSKTSSPSSETIKSDEPTCPVSELGGVFGETIEQLDHCDDCDFWEKCSDADHKRRSAGGKLVARK